jgi:hypothetical protein
VFRSINDRGHQQYRDLLFHNMTFSSFPSFLRLMGHPFFPHCVPCQPNAVSLHSRIEHLQRVQFRVSSIRKGGIVLFGDYLTLFRLFRDYLIQVAGPVTNKRE